MAKADHVTLLEFMWIHNKLNESSTTWADLWIALFMLKAECKRVICIKYSDIENNLLHLSATPKFAKRIVKLNDVVCNLIQRRKELYPDDIYVFQSKSNRVKGNVKPVTATAMNMALKEAAKHITGKNVSMKSALNIIGSGARKSAYPRFCVR
jgi:hypothetical protein